MPFLSPAPKFSDGYRATLLQRVLWASPISHAVNAHLLSHRGKIALWARILMRCGF